ncbi:MAG: hypothetical protein Fur005_23860 [Roseiflexaceae bacterium]
MQKERGWTSWIGGAIFVLAFAGGPILNAIQSMTGIRFPTFTLPILIAALMLLSVVASFQKARSQSQEPNNTPMPPFGGDGLFGPRVPPSSPTATGTPTAPVDTGLPQMPTIPSSVPRMPPPSPMTQPAPTHFDPSKLNPSYSDSVRPPRFDPVASWPLIAIGVVGVVTLIVVGLFVFVGI